jgi:hypothetical protein
MPQSEKFAAQVGYVIGRLHAMRLTDTGSEQFTLKLTGAPENAEQFTLKRITTDVFLLLVKAQIFMDADAEAFVAAVHMGAADPRNRTYQKAI